MQTKFSNLVISSLVWALTAIAQLKQVPDNPGSWQRYCAGTIANMVVDDTKLPLLDNDCNF